MYRDLVFYRIERVVLFVKLYIVKGTSFFRWIISLKFLHAF